MESQVEKLYVKKQVGARNDIGADDKVVLRGNICPMYKVAVA